MPQNLYHQLIRTKQGDWEHFREAASQGLGFPPSPMYDKMTPMKGNPEHLKLVAETHSPHIMARHIEAEHAERAGRNVSKGGGLYSDVKDGATLLATGGLAYVGLKATGALKAASGAITKPISQAATFIKETGQKTAAFVSENVPALPNSGDIPTGISPFGDEISGSGILSQAQAAEQALASGADDAAVGWWQSLGKWGSKALQAAQTATTSIEPILEEAVKQGGTAIASGGDDLAVGLIGNL